MTQGTIEPRQGLTLSRAPDGDLLVIMDGAGMAEGPRVDLGFSGDFFEVSQGGVVYARVPSDPGIAGDLAAAASVKVMEVYKAEDPDRDTLSVHRDVRVSAAAG